MSNPWLESADLVSKFYQLKALNKSANPTEIPLEAPNSNVTNRLLKYNLTWSELGLIDKQALLWDMGLVTYSTNDPSIITQVYTRCNANGAIGREMTTVAMARAHFRDSQKIDDTYQLCNSTVAVPGDTITYFRQGNAAGDSLRNYTNCAIHNITLGVILDSPSSMWAQDGQGLSSIPVPFIAQHAWNDKIYWEIFSIHTQLPENEIRWGTCARSDSPSGIVFPCRVFSGQVEKGFCLPTPSPKMDSWLAELAAAKTIQTTKINTTDIPQILSATTPNNTGIVIAITLGAVAILFLIAFFGFRNFKTKKNMNNLKTSSTTNVSNGIIDLSPIAKSALNVDSLTIQELIGSGAFAQVWRGDFQGKPVAVKTLLSNHITNKGVQNFVNEIALMTTFESPYIVSVVGAAWTRPADLKLVMEYMDMGDLKDYLCNHPSDHFPWSDKLVILRSIVEGLAYLHSMPVIHRDLKSRNVLLDSTKGAKLADFGIAKEDNQETMTVGVGTFRWMAPEVLQDNHYSVAADIYSLGMIMTEMDSHKIPYEDVKNPKTGKSLVDTAIIGAVLNGSLRPEFTTSCPSFIRELAEKCLVHDPNQRPTAFEIAAMLMKTPLD